MGHPTLEAPGVLPGTSGAQMATHAGIHPDNNVHVRGTAIGSSRHPLRRYSHVLPSSVGLDGRAPAILAGSHDCMGAASVKRATWPTPSSGTLTCGCPTACDLGGTMWLHTPPCGSTYGTSSLRNTWKNGKPRSSGQPPSMTLSETLKPCTGPASRSRMTRHVPIVRRQPHRSCHLNDERLAQKGRPAPCPLKWT